MFGKATFYCVSLVLSREVKVSPGVLGSMCPETRGYKSKLG